MKKIAKPIARIDNMPDAKVYRMTPPLQGHYYVLVSAIDVAFTGPETSILACTPDAKIIDWRELEGSFRGDTDHTRALKNAGYKIKYW